MTSHLKKILPVSSALMVFFVLFYALYRPWETHTIYGDDLIMIQMNMDLTSFADKMKAFQVFLKFRPLHDILVSCIIALFQKNLHYYFIFNVAMLSVAAYIFSRIVRLFLGSETLSLFAGIVYGLSHCLFYNITQIIEGAGLETQALIYFLATQYFVLAAVMPARSAASTKPGHQLLWAVLFANLALYTHERYIILFPILMLVVLIPIVGRHTSIRLRLCIAALSLASPLLNYFIKTQLVHMPFLVGTSGSQIGFSPSQMLSFFSEAILSIIQLNHGPEHLTGIPFSNLPTYFKLPALLAAGFSLYLVYILLREGLVAIFRWLAQRVLIPSAIRPRASTHYIVPLALLLAQFVLCLAPVISTIRVEQRWLTAPYAVFVIMVLMALHYTTGTKLRSVAAISTFLLLLVSSNMVYNALGNQHLYMQNAAGIAKRFRDAYTSGIIAPHTQRIIILVKPRDENFENELKWSVHNGAIFKFYYGNPVALLFTDGRFSETDSGGTQPPIPDFNPATDKVIIFQPQVQDITPSYIKDSLRSIVAKINN
jgi:hypothetical protein